MTNVSGRFASPRRLLRRVRSVWPLTVRQRIFLYLVLGALAGLACSGVDQSINANLIDCDVAANSQSDCTIAEVTHHCKTSVFAAGGKCHLSQCTQPCDALTALRTNCPFGKTNGGKAWTVADCQNQGLIAGCTNITLYSFGCYGYTCSDSKCGHH
jgi:hypothetical protein